MGPPVGLRKVDGGFFNVKLENGEHQNPMLKLSGLLRRGGQAPPGRPLSLVRRAPEVHNGSPNRHQLECGQAAYSAAGHFCSILRNKALFDMIGARCPYCLSFFKCEKIKRVTIIQCPECSRNITLQPADPEPSKFVVWDGSRDWTTIGAAIFIMLLIIITTILLKLAY